MKASVKALHGPLKTPADAGIHNPILSAANVTDKALEVSAKKLVAKGVPEDEARKMVGLK